MSITNYSPYLPPEVVNGFFPGFGAVQNHLNSVPGCENTVNEMMRGIFATHTTRCSGRDFYEIESLKDKGNDVYKLFQNSTNSYTVLHLLNNECRKEEFILESDYSYQMAGNVRYHTKEVGKCLYEIVTFPGYAEKDYYSYGFKLAERLMVNYQESGKPSVEHLNQLYDMASKWPHPLSYKIKNDLYQFGVGTIEEKAWDTVHANLGEPKNNFVRLRSYPHENPSVFAAYRESALNVLNYYKVHKGDFLPLMQILCDEDLLDIHEQILEAMPNELTTDDWDFLYSNVLAKPAGLYEAQIKFLHGVLTKKNWGGYPMIYFSLYREPGELDKAITDLLEASKSNEKEKALIKDKLSRDFSNRIYNLEWFIQARQSESRSIDEDTLKREGVYMPHRDLEKEIATNKILRTIAQKHDLKIEFGYGYDLEQTALNILEMIVTVYSTLSSLPSTVSSLWSGNAGTSSQKVEL